MNSVRLPTGIKGLDEMLSGGFLHGSAVLVRGAPGTGKTSLALQYLIHGATKCGEAGLLISFEEFPQSLQRDAQSLGWDLSRLESDGKLHMLFTSPQVLLSCLQTPTSVSHFRRLSDDSQELRKIYNSLINAFKREEITSLLIGEENRADDALKERGRLSFVVDVIVLLRYVEIDSAIQRGIVVLKMRGSDHIKEIRRYEIERGGLRITGMFEGREAILSGAPYRVHTGFPGP
jgi:circadian clock protein KaiC